ncbi:MAG: hypothetical protein LBE12_08800 [Planctomycetaceae bacterium]|jgi:hypothetical protein|nr:hypothetical protein [Planctomycetaceae bacterium]
MSLSTVDILYNELDFSQEKMLEHEQRIENLETALKNTLQILRYLVDSEARDFVQKKDIESRRKV